MPPRVFVSSVVEGFEEYRYAAREGIETAGCEPVMVNEDFPALADSPRNACLDAVRSCDVYVGILGARAGFVAPSGRTVVEEEYGEAQKVGLSTLIFIQEGVEREARQEDFVQRVSEFVGGRYRRTFQTVADLAREIEHALEDIDLHTPDDTEASAAVVDARLPGTSMLRGDSAAIVLAIKSVRNEEVIDPREIEAIGRRLLRLGHEPEVGLFDFEIAYPQEVRDDIIRVCANPPGYRVGPGIAAAEISETGLLYLEASARRGRDSDMMAGMAHHVIHEEDLEELLERMLSFADALFSEIDEFERHQAFMYNAALRHAGHLRIVRDFDPNTSSVTMGIGGEDPVIAHDAARRITRQSLRHPTDEIERTVTLLKRKVNR